MIPWIRIGLIAGSMIAYLVLALAPIVLIERRFWRKRRP